MVNEMTNRMKAIAVAALMCLSATSMTVLAMTDSLGAEAAAVKVGESIKVGGAYKGNIADFGKDIETLTFTLEAAKKCSFSYGFGIGTAKSPYWLEYDGTNDKWIDTKGGTIDVEGTSVSAKDATFTVTIDVSDLDLDYSKNGTFELRNYYCADWSTGKENDLGKITLVSIEANAAGDEEETTEPEVTDPASDGEELGEKDVFTGYWADYAKSGIKNVAISFTADFTGTVNFGMGIGIADDPYWMEYDAKTEKWVDTSDKTAKVDGFTAAVEEGETYIMVYDTSKYELSYNPKSDKYPGRFEFRNNYVSEKGGTITVTKVEVNTSKKSTVVADTGSSGSENDHELSKTDGWSSGNKVSGYFDFTDNKDGTGTMIATQARMIDFEEPYVLTRGFDEEYYLLEGIKWVEGEDPINSHKFSYTDFGLGAVGAANGLVIESLTATITSDRDVLNFMYGGGLNVEKASPADTETAKAEAGVTPDPDAGYWYNDMGEEKIEEYEEAGVQFEIEPGYGYFLTAEEDKPLGKYFNVIWDVPEEVKPYEKGGDISFQYWYGVENNDEFEDYSEVEIDTVNLAGGLITYTEEKTFAYTDTLNYKVGTKIAAGDMSGEINFKDAGVPVGSDVKTDVQAVVFNLTTTQDLDKLVYAVGASVGEEDFQMWADGENDKWNYVITNQEAGKVQIAWMVPKGYDLNEEYGNVQFGYWYGGLGEKELASVTLDSVDIYYSSEVIETEPPTEPPTEPTTEEELKVTLYGDVDVDGKVDIIDVILLNKNLMIGEPITKQGMLNADVDLSDPTAPDEADSLNILKSIVKLITLPVK